MAEKIQCFKRTETRTSAGHKTCKSRRKQDTTTLNCYELQQIALRNKTVIKTLTKNCYFGETRR